MRNVGIIMRRELTSYFATPLAYVFILIFLVLANAFTFYLGGFYERGQADLDPFFNFHPWLYLFLIPAISMKLWAEERKSGTIELFREPRQAVAGADAVYTDTWYSMGQESEADVRAPLFRRGRRR